MVKTVQRHKRSKTTTGIDKATKGAEPEDNWEMNVHYCTAKNKKVETGFMSLVRENYYVNQGKSTFCVPFNKTTVNTR